MQSRCVNAEISTGGKLLVGEVTLRVLGCAVCAPGDPGLQSQGRRGKQHPPCASSLNKILAGDPFQLLPHPCLLRPAPRPRTGLWKPLCQSPLPGRAAEGCFFFFFPFPVGMTIPTQAKPFNESVAARQVALGLPRLLGTAGGTEPPRAPGRGHGGKSELGDGVGTVGTALPQRGPVLHRPPLHPRALPPSAPRPTSFSPSPTSSPGCLLLPPPCASSAAAFSHSSPGFVVPLLSPAGSPPRRASGAGLRSGNLGLGPGAAAGVRAIWGLFKRDLPTSRPM